MSRTQIQNIFDGVSNGFERKLEITGVGYRAAMQGQEICSWRLASATMWSTRRLKASLLPCPSRTEIVISGTDKQVVGQTASRDSRLPAARALQRARACATRMSEILRKEGKKK